MWGKCYRIVGLLGIFVLIFSTAFADEQWLQYRTSDRVQQFLNDAGTKVLVVSTSIPGDFQVPKFISEEPWFGVWETPMTKSGKICFALDKRSENAPYSILYVDTNCNGSLRDETAIKASHTSSFGNNYSQSEFPPVEILFPGEDGPISYHVSIRLNDQGEYRRIYVSPASWYEGNVLVGDKTYRCMLVDHNVNGAFNDPLTDLNSNEDQGDQIRIGTGEDLLAFSLGRYVVVDDVYYNVELAQDGAFVVFKEAIDVQEGTLNVPADISLLNLRGGVGTFFLHPVDGVCRLPVGTYKIDRWEIERKDDAGVLWKAEARRATEPVEVNAGEEQTLDIGEPLIATLSVYGGGAQQNLRQALKGRLGERVSIFRNGTQISATTLRIRNQAGTLDRAESFRFGSRNRLPVVEDPNAIASIEVPGPFKVESETLRLGAQLCVASQPVGEDAVKLVWEINTLFPPPNYYRSRVVFFTGGADDLAGKTFRVMASLDEEHFEQVGVVAGPENSFIHTNVIPNRVYYYKIVAFNADRTKWIESNVTMGAAGLNLVLFSNFETFLPGALPDPLPEGVSVTIPDVFSIVEGGRPWSEGRHILKADLSKSGLESANFYDAPFPLTADKAYLHGGWLRSLGPKYSMLGREYGNDREGKYFYSHIFGLSNDSEWAFAVQLLTCDPESKTSVPTCLENFWEWPKAAKHMRNRLLTYGQAELDDVWVVEVEPPDAVAE